MATESKRELIQANIEAALNAISRGDGFNFTLREENVKRRWIRTEEINASSTPACGIGIGEEVRIEGGTVMGANPKYLMSFPVLVWGWVFSDKTEEIQTLIERLLRDVKIKLFEDKTRGNNAVDTQITRVTTDEGILAFNGFGGFELELEIQYEHEEDAP